MYHRGCYLTRETYDYKGNLYLNNGTHVWVLFVLLVLTEKCYMP